MNSRSPFSTSTVLWLASVGVVLLLLSIVFGGSRVDHTLFKERFGPGAFSTSAVGYAGLYGTLRRAGWPVRRGVRIVSATSGDALLVLAEPIPRHTPRERIEEYARAGKMLVVLPKWRGAGDPENATWVTEVDPVPLSSAQAVLRLTPAVGVVARSEWPETWSVNALGVPPYGEGMAQLVRSRTMRPIVGSADGILVGETVVDGRTVWVLSDPDVMANHGIVRGDNMEFMLALFETLAGTDAADGPPAVVFDEAVHGIEEYLGSPARLLVRFPYSVVSVLVCVAAALLILSGSERPGGSERSAPGFGKTALIDNSARLLERSGHRMKTVRSYIDMTMRLVAAEMHAPPGLEDLELAKWLDATPRARRKGVSCMAILNVAARSEISEDSRFAQMLECAHDIHVWKGEMLDGSGTNRENRH